MRLFEYNVTSLSHSLPPCAAQNNKKDDWLGGKKYRKGGKPHKKLPEEKRSDGDDIADLSKISSQLKPSGFVCGLVRELIDNY